MPIGISDKDLPLLYNSNKVFPSLSGQDLYNHLHFLRPSQADSFYNYQSLVHVPVLDLTTSEIGPVKYRSDDRMPFLEEELEGGGGQGQISEIKIHPSHVRGVSTSIDHRFDIKRMSVSGDSRERWEDEIAALGLFIPPRS
ncbi:hypothetical protein F5Y16DRAFT_396986 [Xylariaceae sp. FL0255]|nr:hypothetical protein F5Y16DRAFT_396986 [Xylariaceae sp. FL0255]